MRKLILFTMMIMVTVLTAQTQVDAKVDNAKNALKAGNVTVGLNTTSLGFKNVDGVTTGNVGLNAGVFLSEGFAVVGTAGYTAVFTKDQNSNDWFYGAGLKYYFANKIPVQADWRGSIDKSYVGVQGGYAWFPFTNFSVEPTLRYEWTTMKKDKNEFSGGLGFNLFF